MKLNWFLLLTIGAFQTHAQEVPCDVTAETESGMVCGTIKKDIRGNDFASFTGIPYAKAPRFAPPQPRGHFGGVFNATIPGPACPQIPNPFAGTQESTPMDEDCLRLDIHVPKDSLPGQGNEAPVVLKVLVFIHGGSFDSGASSLYGADFLMPKGIIVVVVQYRLNVFGFFNLESKEIPGNNGIRDVLFSLEWVQQNIRYFGGNHLEVTLSGHSAGADIVSLITLIPPSRKGPGLFKRVLALSGTALANSYSPAPEYSRFIAQLFLDGMGLRNKSKRAIHEELINKPMSDILEGLAYVINRTDTVVTFCPVVETRQDDYVLLPNDPECLMNKGYGRQYTTWMSFTNNECNPYSITLERTGFITKLKEQPEQRVPQNLLINSNILTIPALTAAITDRYFNGSHNITMENLLPLCTDSNFKYPVLRMTRGATTFLSQFGYASENSTIKDMLGIDYPGAGHAEDISYIFKLAPGEIQSNELNQPDDDSRMRELMTTYVANYVKTGIPHSEWLPAGPELDFMNINDPMNPQFGPAPPEMVAMKDFFDDLYRAGRGI